MQLNHYIINVNSTYPVTTENPSIRKRNYQEISADFLIKSRYEFGTTD